jgi:hypothetical protein
LRAVGALGKQTASHSTVNIGGGRRLGRWSVCPAAKDRRADWKCCQCTEWVCKDHYSKKNQTKCDNCQEQSQCWQISFTLMFLNMLSCAQIFHVQSFMRNEILE